MAEEIKRVEKRIETIENRQLRHEQALTDTIERVRDLSISMARQDERLIGISRTVHEIHELQKEGHRAATKRLQATGDMKQKLSNDRMMWIGGFVFALLLLIINIILLLVLN